MSEVFFFAIGENHNKTQHFWSMKLRFPVKNLYKIDNDT